MYYYCAVKATVWKALGDEVVKELKSAKAN